MSTLYGGRPCVDPAVLYDTCRDEGLPLDWWKTANLFRVPLGRGPGSGCVLLTKADLDALDLKADHTLSFDDDRTTAPPVRLQKITLLRAKCLTPGHRDDERAVYLCDVVDRRHFLAQVPCDKAYNVKNADGDDYLAATDNGGSPWTWQEIVDDLVAALGLDPLTLPFTPDGDPENLRYHAGWAWESLCDVLDRLACAVKYDPVDDVFTVVRLGDTAATGATALTTALARHDRDGLRTWDAYHQEPDRGRLPEKVRVLFQNRPQPIDGSSPYTSVDVTLDAADGVEAGTYVQLHDDLTATGSNGAALATRAAERAADWRRKRVGYERRVTLVYRDFRPDLKPGETVEQVALDDHGGPMVTVLESGPDGAMERWKEWTPPLLADPEATSAFNCRAKLAGLRANECVLFDAPANDFFTARSFGGRYVAASGGWEGLDFFETGDGITFPVLFRKAEGGMGLRLVGATTTWYAEFLGCRDGVAEFAVPYCPPDTLDGSGADSDTVAACTALAGCTDHTFRVRVSCVACGSADALRRARVTVCENFGSTPVTLYLTITGVTGSCAAGLVGITVPMYYIASQNGYVPLQADLDAAGFPCGTTGWNGYPESYPYLFATGGCNIFYRNQNGYAGDLPTSTAPFVYEGSWNSDIANNCCPSPPGGSIEFSLTEDAP